LQRLLSKIVLEFATLAIERRSKSYVSKGRAIFADTHIAQPATSTPPRNIDEAVEAVAHHVAGGFAVGDAEHDGGEQGKHRSRAEMIQTVIVTAPQSAERRFGLIADG
jgi:hypothetical protein